MANPTVEAIDCMSASESLARAISGEPALDVLWMDEGVPYATAKRQIALVRPRSLTHIYRWVYLSDLIHECGHIVFTKWEVVDRFQKHGPSLDWEWFRSIWNAYEDVFEEHASMREAVGAEYTLRKGSFWAREFGCVKRPDGKIADLIPITIVFHDFAMRRQWDEWRSDFEEAWKRLAKEVDNASVMNQFLSLLEGGEPDSTADAIKRARITYQLFEDFINRQNGTPSSGEVVQFDKAKEQAEQKPSESKPGEEQNSANSKGDEDEGESKVGSGKGDESEDRSSGDSDQDDVGAENGEEHSENVGKPDSEGKPSEDDQPHFVEVLSGGSYDGVYFPEVRRLRLSKHPLTERCRSALERFDTPVKRRRTSHNGRLRAAVAWQTQAGNSRVFRRNRRQIDHDLPALALLGDISGSMKRYLSDMFHGFAGILTAYERSQLPVAAWAFGARSGELVNIKGFSEPVDLGQARLASTEELAGGDTPFGQAVHYAMDQLSSVRHPNRRVVVLSDGLVNAVDRNLARQAQQWYGVEVTLISIGCECPPIEGVQSFSVDSAEQLPEVLRQL